MVEAGTNIKRVMGRVVETGMRAGYLVVEIPGGVIHSTIEGLGMRFSSSHRDWVARTMVHRAKRLGDMSPWDNITLLFLEPKDSDPIKESVRKALYDFEKARLEGEQK